MSKEAESNAAAIKSLRDYFGEQVEGIPAESLVMIARAALRTSFNQLKLVRDENKELVSQLEALKKRVDSYLTKEAENTKKSGTLSDVMGAFRASHESRQVEHHAKERQDDAERYAHRALFWENLALNRNEAVGQLSAKLRDRNETIDAIIANMDDENGSMEVDSDSSHDDIVAAVGKRVGLLCDWTRKYIMGETNNGDASLEEDGARAEINMYRSFYNALKDKVLVKGVT